MNIIRLSILLIGSATFMGLISTAFSAPDNMPRHIGRWFCTIKPGDETVELDRQYSGQNFAYQRRSKLFRYACSNGRTLVKRQNCEGAMKIAMAGQGF